MLIVSEGHRDFVTGWTAHGAGTALKRIHPFGREIFHKKLEALNNRFVSVLFTGEEAPQLAPENNKFFRVMG
jgi:hypothetical protein